MNEISPRPNEPVVAFETELGTCAVRWTPEGIAAVRLPSRLTRSLRRLEEREDVPVRVREAIHGIVDVLAGSPVDLRFIVLDERGADAFARDVFAATRDVRAGTTVTYGTIARAVGRPEAAREVGAALARNPYPIIVPCHRVVGAGGKLTGFSAPGGLVTKRRMLELEGAPGFGQQVLFG